MKKTIIFWLCPILLLAFVTARAENDDPCGIHLQLTQRVSFGQSHRPQATETLVAMNVVDRDAKADYQAGHSITLLPGFSAERGASFVAQVKSCDCGTESDVNRLTLTAYPNPFVEATVIRYHLTNASPVNLSLFDEQGQLVKVLVNNEIQEAGFHEYTYRNSTASSMVYLYSLRTGQSEISKRLIKQR